ncbi:molybdopterin cofactor-binding domain-containing protein [Undibacterium arcticum]
MSLTPVKFGIAFNVTHFNQAGALVHVYTDGSVLVNHGGTEMGQGINTKVCQVVAHELGISLEMVRATATDTSKVANTSATAASTGADLNGKAAQDAANTIRQRLAEFAVKLYGGDQSSVGFANGFVHVNSHAIPFAELVQKGLLGAGTTVVRRLLCDAWAALGPADQAWQPLLLLRVRCGGL